MVKVATGNESRLAVVAGPDLTTPEPDNAHRGLNVVDFPPPKSIWWSVRKGISLLPPEKRRLLFLATGVQVSLGILDLVGIALIGLVAAIAVSGLGVSSIPPWAQSLLDGIGLGGLTVSQLSVVVALSAVLILVLKTLLSALMARRITQFLANRQADVSVRLAREFLSRPLIDVQRWTTPEAIYALGSGVAAATVMLLGSAIIIASEVFLFTIVGVALLVYDPILTLTAAGFFAVIVLFLHRFLGNWTARNAAIMRDASIDTLTAVSEALGTYRETTVMNRRDLYVARYESLVGRFAGATATTTFIQEIPKYVLEAALYLGVLVLGVVQFLSRDWATAAATVALFLAAGSRVIPAMLRLQGAGITIRNGSVQAQPTFYLSDFLQHQAQRSPQPSGARVNAAQIHEHVVRGYPDFTADVFVKEVFLTYPDATEPALDCVSFSANPGTSVALVGATGSGKSTLADVVLGVLQPAAGQVATSGIPPREAVERWPGAIGYVPQTVALVAGSVRQNVALGLPDEAIDDDLAWEALRRAHLAEFLIANREGLDTPIGERGFKLSGGQRQRLGIARALYTRPRLLVLDEATSALDAETEQAIIQTLRELEGEVTTITVAHRLATVRHADQVLYLSRGRIEARGSFEEVRSSVPDFDKAAALLGL